SGSSKQDSPSLPFLEKSRTSHHTKGNSSIEEVVQTAADNSIRSDNLPSLPDSVSVAIEYSVKFDDSMTEDDTEEKSFRPLLPSKSHRCLKMGKKRSQQDDSDEDILQDQSASVAVK
ncbi:centrosome-associated protein 350-like, partial [Chiloscyllium plagiosum]|uniref:centrosome-associated protein 350-like n=1 Tax=Chiloscyllium plagiosum TaxID=36176 RepID=UPI001CB816F9